MNHNICYNCGGVLCKQNGRLVCIHCGSYRPEEITNEEITLLYTAFQKLRLADFFEAEQEFDDIIHRYPKNAQAYWGRLMARYGIKYEEDYDGRRIPTCYATSIESVFAASDYRKAMEYADRESGEIFLHGKKVLNKSPRESIANGFALVTEERRANGIFGVLNIRENTVISSLKKHSF